MRKYLKETIKPLIPEEVRNAIKEVNKYTLMYDSSGTITTYTNKTIDDVWIPHYREITGYDTDSKNYYYKNLFPNKASRKKGTAENSAYTYYWLRQPISKDCFYYISFDGGTGSHQSEMESFSVLIGFCM